MIATQLLRGFRKSGLGALLPEPIGRDLPVWSVKPPMSSGCKGLGSRDFADSRGSCSGVRARTAPCLREEELSK